MYPTSSDSDATSHNLSQHGVILCHLRCDMCIMLLAMVWHVFQIVTSMRVLVLVFEAEKVFFRLTDKQAPRLDVNKLPSQMKI